ncbi:YybH family protein [Rhodocaloribacter sp.]
METLTMGARRWVVRAASLSLVLLAAFGCRNPTPEPAFDAAEAGEAVRGLLRRQVDAWNRGDVEAFMDGYARTDSLRFASGGTVRRGWQTTLDRYHDAYPDRSAMGTLAFDSLEVRVLSPRWATVFGRWHLKRGGAYEDIGGLFTLLFEKRPEGWRIVADHTSSGG